MGMEINMLRVHSKVFGANYAQKGVVGWFEGNEKERLGKKSEKPPK